MAAVRVPPSAWSTSQSRMMLRSPSASRSTIERSERPIRRWISMVRPDARPFDTSRGVRVAVARGSMEYSAVTQPLPELRRKCGNGVFDGRGAEHLRVADFDQDRAFGGEQVVLRDFERAQLIGLALIDSHDGLAAGLEEFVKQQRDKCRAGHDEQQTGDGGCVGSRGGGLARTGRFEFCHRKVTPIGLTHLSGCSTMKL